MPGLLEYRQTYRRTDQGIEVRRRFELKVPRVELVDYGRFRDALREVRLAEARTISIRVGGESL